MYIASQDKIPIFIKRKKPKYAVYNVHIHDFRLYPRRERELRKTHGRRNSGILMKRCETFLIFNYHSLASHNVCLERKKHAGGFQR